MGNFSSTQEFIDDKKKIIFNRLWKSIKSQKFEDKVNTIIKGEKENFLRKIRKQIDTGITPLTKGYTDKDKYYNYIKENTDLLYEFMMTRRGSMIFIDDEMRDSKKDMREKGWNKFIDKFLSDNHNEDKLADFTSRLYYNSFIRNNPEFMALEDINIIRTHDPDKLKKMIANDKEGFQNSETENDFSTILVIIIFALLFLHAFTDTKLL